MTPSDTPGPTTEPTRTPGAMIRALPWVGDGVNSNEKELVETLYFVSEHYPQILAGILDMPWVRVDKDLSPEIASQAIFELTMLEDASPGVVQAVLQKDLEWMTANIYPSYSSTLVTLYNMARDDERVALQILNMQFLDSLEGVDRNAFGILVELATTDPSGLDYVLSHPDFIDGISDEEAILVPLVSLEWTDPDAAELIQGLSWVADGVAYWPPADYVSSSGNFQRRAETSVLTGLIELSRENREVFLALASKPWLQNELTGTVYQLFGNLEDLPPQVLLRLLKMPFLDEANEEDIGTVQTLRELAWESPVKVGQLLDRPGLRVGITDENHFIVRLLYLEFTNPEAADALHQLPWVADGIDQSEEAGALALIYTGVEAGKLFPELVERPWVVDGLDRNEVSAIVQLKSTASDRKARTAPSVAISLLDMPFLESVDGTDAAALDTIDTLRWQGEGETDYLSDLLSHPTLEGGITDEDAVFLALLNPIASYHTEFMQHYLDHGSQWVAHRTIELPYTGKITLAVLEDDLGRLETLDLLERTVRAQEGFMQEPFPPGFAGIVVSEVDSGGGPSGIITVHPESTRDIEMLATYAAFAYWPLPHPTWMSGGAIFLLAWMTVLDPPLPGSPPIAFECELARNAAELERLENEAYESIGSPDVSILDHPCHYDMGLGLYLHLYTSLENEVFHEGLSRLYQSTQYFGNLDCDGDKQGLCLVRDAFVNHATPADAAIATEIIDYWYYGDPLGKEKQ